MLILVTNKADFIKDILYITVIGIPLFMPAYLGASCRTLREYLAELHSKGSQRIVQSKPVDSTAPMFLIEIPKIIDERVQRVTREEWLKEYYAYDNDMIIPRIREDHKAHFFKVDQDSSTPGLSQCRATYVFNLETGKYFVHHSSLGITNEVFNQLNQLGPGRKIAVVVGEWSGSREGKALSQDHGIPTEVFHLSNATSHINVVYRASDQELKFFYADHNAQGGTAHWIGRWRLPSPQ